MSKKNAVAVSSIEPTKKEKQVFRAVLILDELNPIRAFEYFIYRQAGYIDPTCCLIVYRPAPPCRTENLDLHSSILLLSGTFEYQDYLTLHKTRDDKSLTERQKHTLRKMFYFLRDHVRTSEGLRRKDVREMFELLHSKQLPAEIILESLNESFERFLRKGADLARDSLYITWQSSPSAQSVMKYPDVLYQLNVPAFQPLSGQPVHKHILRSHIVHLRPMWHLMHEQLCILICGHAGKGKSTVAYNLLEAMPKVIKEVQRIPGWDRFSLKILAADLDRGTPTLTHMCTGRGQNRGLTEADKRPWTIDLAYEAAELLSKTKSAANIVIGDMPGGLEHSPIDAITQITALGGDCAIIVASSNAEYEQWMIFCNCMGIQVIGRIDSEDVASTIPGANGPSTLSLKVRHLTPKLKIRAMLVGGRRIMSKKSAMELARSLVYEMLPSFVTRRMEKGKCPKH